MTIIHTGEEGKRIRMAIHQYFLDSKRKSIISTAINLTLCWRSKDLGESFNRMYPKYENAMLEKGAETLLNPKERMK